MPETRAKPFWKRALLHFFVVACLWFFMWFAIPSGIPFITQAGLLIGIAPGVEGEILDGVARHSLNVHLPYPMWMHIAFLTHWSLLVFPAVWRPFEHKRLNFWIPGLLFVASTIVAFSMLRHLFAM